jgi:hypothetical protein
MQAKANYRNGRVSILKKEKLMSEKEKVCDFLLFLCKL